jgi:AcrR family transcriptional regulator
MTDMKTNTVRPYVMIARAETVAATRERILDSARRLFIQHAFEDVTIEMVAAGAETTARTVLRVFGSKDELFAEVLRSIGQFQQSAATPAAPAAIVSEVYEFYEKVGDTVIRWLADESRVPAMHEHLNIGRQHLRGWVADAFAPVLKRSHGNARKELHDALIVALDIYTWKLLRRDFGLSRAVTQSTVLRIVRGLIGEESNG